MQLVRNWGVCSELFSFPSGIAFTHRGDSIFKICLKFCYPHYRQWWRKWCQRPFTIVQNGSCWRNEQITLIHLQQIGSFLQEKFLFLIRQSKFILALWKINEKVQTKKLRKKQKKILFLKVMGLLSTGPTCPTSPQMWCFFPLEEWSFPQLFIFLCHMQWWLN